DQLALRGAALRMVRTPGTRGVLSLTATGGRLTGPMGTLATFPTLTMSSDLTIDRTVRFGLDLGPALRISTADYRFRLTSDGVLRLDLPTGSRPTVTAIAGSASARLDSLDLRSSGTFDLDVTGRIAFFGFRIVEARMDADLRDGVLRLAVDSRINLGFESLRVDGWWDSTGAFRLTGGFDAEVGLCPAGCLAGGIEVTIDSRASISGDFDGRVCLFGGCAETVGSMSASGRVTGSVRLGSARHPFDFQIGDAPEDTIRPTFSPNPPPDLTVNQDVAGGEGRVSYLLPSATDRRDSTSASFAAPVTCSPAPGAVFPVGTTTVSCTARDAADNTRSASFRLTLVDTTPDAPLVPLVLAGSTSRTGGIGFASGTGFTVALFSEPRVLASGTVPEDGVVDVAVRVPPALPPGVHTLVVSGTAADGGALVHATRIRVGGAVEPRLVLRSRPRSLGGRVSVPEGDCLDRARIALVRVTGRREVTVDRTRLRLVARTGGLSARYGMERPTRRGTYRVELRRSDCEAVSREVVLERSAARSGRSASAGRAQETSM
ncbi:MAG: HYR domain-containing protein, partial [Actinobacteria bacterium]|nr:HYR domain-containing protein [Actinomycetota bacterium]